MSDEQVNHFIQQIIEKAIEKSASDLHIENYENFSRVRLRQDGVLHEIMRPAISIMPRLITRLKLMAALDIAEKRKPQDGRCQFQTKEKTINIRVNACPTLFGEKIVLRLLDGKAQLRQLDATGFSDSQLALIKGNLSKPQGLILVTGPTGSGKTITLYAALQHINHDSKNISTVEDPVEINFSGINQVNIQPKAEIYFHTILRAFLRQDPDVIMVGEIRDLETAEIAIKAAQTGHLVLSTLHTNSTKQALTRLINMGIKKYNLQSAITLITAQRLLRKLCPSCKKATQPTKIESECLNLSTNDIIYKPVGCDKCHQGYLGRFAIHETLPLSEESFFKAEPEITLKSRATDLVKNGLTSIEEMIRAIGI